MPKNWKHIKKTLEKNFLCKKLKGHITYQLTTYNEWYKSHFVMKYDDKILLETYMLEHWWNNKSDMPINIQPCSNSCIANDFYKKHKHSFAKYKITQCESEAIICSIIDETVAYISHYNGFYGTKEIIDIIGIYLHSNIQDCLCSQEYFIKALAILDRRCGKRTLEKYAKYDEISAPDWLKQIYRLRFEAEGLKYSNAYH